MDVVIFRIIPNIIQHFVAFTKIFDTGRFEGANKFANKIEHFGLDKSGIFEIMIGEIFRKET
ncbi:MAG: hypothetical protein EAZ78_05160 [Oscillatoriales cyanobacterium]|uniref:hypothetical protein n=1 Tax=Microcoleus anatoxicus TaxID=2705319 RepID=UPI0029722CF9|nr:MAG: hypothetical protein EA000_07330 [Oscillatoriales cyanobacterium]TAF05607.1 MAG: hypothetical protein EAZ78_05160 [Oscillatoriales cyanobacterium]TAF59994.1 MAG: hypothetical protein EAZ59_26915 [Oscillatoriales cyanobacterium]